MAVPPWPHAAEVTETHVIAFGRVRLRTLAHLSTNLPSSLRIHGEVVVSHGTRRIGIENNPAPGWSFGASFDDNRAPFDHLAEVADPAVFRSYDACRDLIYGTLADGPVTGEYDLAPGNGGGGPARPPIDFARLIGRQIESKGEAFKRFDVDIELPSLLVYFVYSEPQALIHACKEAAAAGSLAAPGGECVICYSELEPDDEEIIRLPCFHSHAFHTPCCRASHRGSTASQHAQFVRVT